MLSRIKDKGKGVKDKVSERIMHKANLLAPLARKNPVEHNPSEIGVILSKEKEGRMKKAFIVPLIAILLVAILVTGFTADREKNAKLTLEERIKKLEAELSMLKLDARKAGGLEPDVIKDGPEKKSGTRAFLDGTRGWRENGTDMWTAMNYEVGINTPLPQYDLDVNGDLRINGGINDGLSFGSANNVLVSDGAGGVAWSSSPGGVADYIWNQDTFPQDNTTSPANFWIEGTGRADYSLIGISSVDSDFGVFGWSAAATGNGQGVYGTADSDLGFGGVFIGGNAGTWWSITGEDAGVSGTGMAYGVMGWGHDATAGGEGIGVLGVGDAQAATGVTMYSGSGVCGYSESYNGVFGSTPADTAFGVYGYNSGIGGTGVFGVGNGIAGSYWGGSGVSGASDDVGVFGFGDATSRSYGALGLTIATDGMGTVGWANAAAYWQPPTGRDAGVVGDGGYYGVYAVGTRTTAPQGIGVAGLGNNSSSITSPNGGAGVLGNGVTFGVWGYASTVDATASVYGYAGGPFSVLTGMEIGTAGSAYDGVGIFGEVTEVAIGWAGYFIGDVACTGNYYESDGPNAGGNILTPGILASPLGDNGAIVYSMTSSEVKIYFDGEGQLSNGKAYVEIPSAYSDVIAGNVEVVVTSIGSWSGMYIASTTQQGFEVRSENGDPNAKFKWIAVAERKGYEKDRSDSYVLSKLKNLPKAVAAEVNSAQMTAEDGIPNIRSAAKGKREIEKPESKAGRKASSLK